MTEKMQLPEQRPLWQQISDVLEDHIIHRSIEPGSRLREQELAEQFGVSRGPVREAMLALERAGWVEIRHRRGAYVRTPEPKEVKHVLEVRESLEARAAALASQRISEPELSELDDIIEEGLRALKAEDLDALVDLNTQLHRKIARSTNNSILCDMLEQLEKRIVWVLSAVMPTRGHDSWVEHRDLVEALRQNDAGKAAEIMKQHTRSTLAAYLRVAVSSEVGIEM